ncbi:hypothetical protein A4H97_04670 [Niastella yeongjuensis]|uniref:Uncharacterized protein n=1 Tax=Niastella yeongjuensis TaxID=354355 RepID=A0A1V9EL76_9BACT|nr:hypothetical protein [Niastella yeongjuensis]OQP46821.1 hypothetical protein A4H97_04670 [Niastella yeongjuensis]SEN55759.1 hypothetical protein SAMN05660816_00957 [Niastella yeongjuensis]
MKTGLIKLFLSQALLTSFASGLKAQTKLTNKTFKAEIGQLCKDELGTIYTYCLLNFKKDSVTVSTSVIADVPPEKKDIYEHADDNSAKVYKWKAHNNLLSIIDCKEYSQLTIKKSQLVYHITSGDIIFTEEKSIQQ